MHNPMAKALAIMLFMSQALIIKLRSLNYQILDSYLGPVQHLSHHHIIGGAIIKLNYHSTLNLNSQILIHSAICDGL